MPVNGRKPILDEMAEIPRRRPRDLLGVHEDVEIRHFDVDHV
jgi:hypothetical protein